MKRSKLINLIGGIVFFLVGIWVAVCAIKDYKKNVEFMEKALTVTATISDIKYVRSSNGGGTYKVYVAYEVDGIRYENKLIEHAYGMFKGAPVTIYYHPNDPSKYSTSYSGPSYILGIASGLLFALAGLLLLFTIPRKHSDNYMNSGGEFEYDNLNKIINNKKKEFVGPLIAIVFGVLWLYLGISQRDYSKETESSIKSTHSVLATITEVTTDVDEIGKYYSVKLLFEIDGKSYTKIACDRKGDTSNLQDGKKVTVYYEPGDPPKVLSALYGDVSNRKTFSDVNIEKIEFLVCMIGGGAFFIFGIGMLISTLKQIKKYKKLLNNRSTVYATIDIIDRNFSKGHYKSASYTVKCYYVAPSTNLLYEFRSKQFSASQDFEKRLSDNRISTVPVYIDSDNNENYYVDTEWLKQNIFEGDEL